MNLKAWKEETFELLLNNGRFQITDSGPLCSPIKNFEIKRDDKQRLLLTTHCDPRSRNGSQNSPEFPAGTIHSVTAGITLSSPYMTVIAKAHGNATIPDGSIELMRDIQLLKNTFHRIVISMTGASSQYNDCYTPEFPIRQLRETVDASDRIFFER